MKTFIRITVSEIGEEPKVYQLLGSEPLKVGREPGNDIILKDSGVSRFHATFMMSGDTCVLSDLFSRNGTFVNGSPIKQDMKIASHDVINIGSSKLLVQYVEGGKIPSNSDGSELTTSFELSKLMLVAFWLRPSQSKPREPFKLGNWDSDIRKTLTTFGATIVAERTEVLVASWEASTLRMLLEAIERCCRKPTGVAHQCAVWLGDAVKGDMAAFTFMGEPIEQALRYQAIVRQMSVPVAFDKHAATALSRIGVTTKHVMTVKVKGEPEPVTFFTLEN